MGGDSNLWQHKLLAQSQAAMSWKKSRHLAVVSLAAAGAPRNGAQNILTPSVV